ncbi:cation-translocating P-type ATPase [Pedococcus sp. NPDC057267]|uniref:cation-translocating P-type ATPase n=1 Tax=Pedococcus sp. NPDC057267 TaxID=3346077 RepID=UPI00362CD927
MADAPVPAKPPTATPAGVNTAWHALTPAQSLARLGAGEDGLSDLEVRERAGRFGPNLARVPKRESWLEEFGESFTEPLQLLLVAVAVLSFLFGEVIDGLAIVAVIMLAAAVETSTEMRAQRSVEALHEMTAPTARVLRDGAGRTIPAAEVVPGDVLLLEAGDIVPADARVLTASALTSAEASLTGEPGSVPKAAEPVDEGAPLAGRASVVHAGCVVTGGAGTAVVFGTGAGTQVGKVAALTAGQREPVTPLQLGMARVAKLVLVFAVVVSVGVPLLGWVLGQPVKEMVLTALSMAFATVPEELPVLVTILLAVGGRALAGRGALLRRLSVGEAIGSVTTLLTDKTGTLTRNELTVTAVDGDTADVLATALAAQGAGTGSDVQGCEPLELAVAARATELPVSSPLAVAAATVVGVWPFDQAARMRGTAWRTPDGREVLAVAGAPEAVLAACTPEDQQRWGGRVADALAGGHRTIGYATGEHKGRDQQPDDDVVDEALPAVGLRMVGLVTFTDPVRDGVPDAVTELHDAGIATIVVTGDHPSAGRAVAHAAGLPDGPTLTGGQALAARTDDDLAGDLVHGTVVGRCTPADKLRLVRLLQDRGQVVAVTGDGVNDAPALSAADVGIAMGQRGTQMARDAAGLVLTDDAYPTVAAAVEKGRSIFSQLRRGVSFYLGAKLALVTAMVAAVLAGLPVPYAPVQIVLLELFMDVGASLAFVSEPAAPAAMRQPPRPRNASLVDGAFTTATVLVGLTLGTAATVGYLASSAVGASTGQARCAALVVWLVGHVAVAWSLRARPALGWGENPFFPLWAGAATVVALVAAFTPAAAWVRAEPLAAAQMPFVVGAVAGCALLAWLGRPVLGTGTDL